MSTYNTAYKSGTFNGIPSGTTFTVAGSTPAAGDVGRWIIVTSGSGNLQLRKVLGFSGQDYTVSHAWDVNAFLEITEVTPSSGDNWVLSYDMTDLIAGDADLTLTGNHNLAIATMILDTGAYVHAEDYNIEFDSRNIEIRNTSGLILGDYGYVSGEDAYVKSICNLTDTASGALGEQMAGSRSANNPNFGSFHMYGGTIYVPSSNFWRIYDNTPTEDETQTRIIGTQIQGSFGGRVDGNKSIIDVTSIGSTNVNGLFNFITSGRVSVSALDSDQALYIHRSLGPSGQATLKRLSDINNYVVRVANTGAGLYTVIAKKSEVDAAPAFFNSASVEASHTMRLANYVEPTFVDDTGALITDSIKTLLIDSTTAIVNSETITTGVYTPYLIRHTDVTGAAPTGDKLLSDGIQYAPYSLRALTFGKNILNQAISGEDIFNGAITLLNNSSLTELIKATIDAYTSTENAYKLYDRAYSDLFDNYAGEITTTVDRETTAIDLKTLDIIVNGDGTTVYNLTGSVITIKATVYTGGFSNGTISSGTGSPTFSALVLVNATWNVEQATWTGSADATTTVDVASTGTYDATGFVFDASSTLNNSSGGLVNIVINAGQQQPVVTGGGTTNFINAGATVTFNNLVSANVQIMEGDNITVNQRSTSQTGTLVFNTPDGSSGTWCYIINRAGYSPIIGTYTADGLDVTVDSTQSQKLLPDGTIMYQGTTSALLSIMPLPDGSRMNIRVGDGAVSAQNIFDETEDALQTQDGMTYICNGGGQVSIAVLPVGTFVFMEINVRVIRDAIGDINATINAFVQSTDGIVLDGTNGSVQFITPTSDVNLISINGNTIPVDNLELQYDGTGITGPSFPATQDQVANVVVAGAAINVISSSYVLTTGTQTANTYTATQALDGIRHTHTDIAGTMDLYYEFDLGSDGVPTGVKSIGALSGQNDSVGIYAWNWVLNQWDQIGTRTGSNNTNNTLNSYDLLTSHVGTGANIGITRIRFFSSGLTNATLYIDQLLVAHTRAASGIANGSTVTLTTSTINKDLIGEGWKLNLGGQDISGSYIHGAINVSGIATATQASKYVFEDCDFSDVTLSATGRIRHSIFSMANTLNLTSTAGIEDDILNLVDCVSGVAGSGTPHINTGAVTKASSVSLRRWSGGLKTTLNSNVTMSVDVVSGGIISVYGTGGSINIRGICKVLDFSSGAVTIVSTSVINDETIAAAARDILTQGTAQGAGSGDAQIQLEATASAVNGSYDPSLISLVGGTGSGQSRLILEYDGTSKIAAVDRSWRVAPDATTEYIVTGTTNLVSINEGLLQGATSNTATLNSSACPDDECYTGQTVWIRGGTGEDQANLILSYNGTTKVAVLADNWTTIPDTTSVYMVIPNSPVLLAPTTHTGVVIPNVTLVDTTTTNTDMRGTDNASLPVDITNSQSAIVAEVNANEVKIDLLETKAQADTRQASLIAEHDTTQSDLTSVLADTDELQTNQGNWTTATGFSTPTDVTNSQSAIVAEVNANETKIDGIKTKTDLLNFTGSDVKATLDGEVVVTDTASREASKANIALLL